MIARRFETWLIARLTDLVSLSRLGKRSTVIAVDIVACIAAAFLAFALRVGALSFPFMPVAIVIAVAVPLFIPLFFWSGVYGSIFRYAGARTVYQIGRAISIYTVVLVLAFMLNTVPGVPRTVALIQPVLFFGFVSFSRLAARHLFADLLGIRNYAGQTSNVLIYGAGMAGQQLSLSLRHDPRFRLVGFIDDDEVTAGHRLDGMPIYAPDTLRETIALRAVHTVLLALPSISRRRKREIIEMLGELDIHVQTLPSVHEVVDGRVSISDLREVQIQDLLGRDPVAPNDILLGRTTTAKTVLVTGAGGSIGSELCRQILANGARRLILLEQSEFALYTIESELNALADFKGSARLEIVPVLGSITDAATLERIFEADSVDTIFHAAAYKHVPLVESNCIAGILNNFVGTYTLAKKAAEAGVKDFILISTDKAVRPTNVMGASKRAAEQVVQAMATLFPDTCFSMVRFGNVLGSSGSVVPLFQRQIEAGGPITLTHRDVTRYFMTIEEASNLVIQAGGLAQGGEVFVLDMGKPVKIIDLARSMVKLSGLTLREDKRPDGDIEIRETGLRPGEKLYEELLIGADPVTTSHEKIMMAREHFAPMEKLEEVIGQLRTCDEPARAIELLAEIVPEMEHRRDDGFADPARKSGS